MFAGRSGEGSITFVGLGPGDARLRTRRAEERLAAADAVLPSDETRLDGAIALARDGQRVVRTVCGDPYESAACVVEIGDAIRAGVAVEVVPGVGANAAAAAFAGVVGSARWVSPDDLDQALASHSPEERLTLVIDAGQPTQRMVVTTVADALGRRQELRPQGSLVAWGLPESILRWFERRPLFGKRIVVTRALEQSTSMADLLREWGAEPVTVPTLVLRPPHDSSPLIEALHELRRGGYAWVAFTSANGVTRTWEALRALGVDARAFGSARIAAIGPATAASLERYGLTADVVAKEFRGEGLADEMLRALRSGPADARILLTRAARARDALPTALREAGYRVDVVAAYVTDPADPQGIAATVGELEAGRIDAVTFTSSSTVEHFCEAIGPRAPEFLKKARVASIGPITSATAAALGVRVDVTAREFTVPGLVHALAESYAVG